MIKRENQSLSRVSSSRTEETVNIDSVGLILDFDLVPALLPLHFVSQVVHELFEVDLIVLDEIAG